MMRRIAAILFLLTWVATPAFAWTHLAFVTGGPTSTSSPVTATAWANARPSMTMIMACGDVSGGTLTPVVVGTNPWTQLSCTGSSLPVGAGTFEMNFWSRTVSNGAEPGTFGATFGDAGHSGCWIGYIQASDGTAPVIDACRVDYTASSGGNITNGALSTVTNDDYILGLTIGAWQLTGFAGGADPYATEWADGINFINTSWNTGGAGTAGALPLVTYNFTASSAAQALATIAFKNNTTTAVNFIGRGSQIHSTGSPTSLTLTYPTNGFSANTQLVQIDQGGGTVGTVSLQLGGDKFTAGGSPATWEMADELVDCGGTACTLDTSQGVASTTLTIGAGAVPVGAAMTAYVCAGAGAGCATGWTQKCTDTVNFPCVLCARTANSTDNAGTSYTFSGSSGPGILFNSFHGASSSTYSASTCSNQPSATTALTPAITPCGHANCTMVDFGWQGSSNAVTVPTNTTALTSGITDAKHSYRTVTANGSPWTSLGTATSPNGDSRIDAFWRTWSSTESPNLYVTLNGSPTNAGGAIYNLANLNATTPFDVTVAEGDGTNTTPIYPTLTPSSTDEAVFGVSTLGGEQNGNAYFWLNMLSGLTGVGAQMNPLTLATGWPVTNQAPNADGAQIVLGLNANTLPTLGSASVRAQQAGYDLFTNALITPAAGGQSIFGYVAQ